MIHDDNEPPQDWAPLDLADDDAVERHIADAIIEASAHVVRLLRDEGGTEQQIAAAMQKIDALRPRIREQLARARGRLPQ